MKWILICLISIDTGINAVPCTINNDLVYRPTLSSKTVVYTFDTEEELKEYLQWSVGMVFYSMVDKKGRSPLKEIIGLYYGKKIGVSPIYEEKKRESVEKILKGYEINAKT